MKKTPLWAYVAFVLVVVGLSGCRAETPQPVGWSAPVASPGRKVDHKRWNSTLREIQAINRGRDDDDDDDDNRDVEHYRIRRSGARFAPAPDGSTFMVTPMQQIELDALNNE